MIEIDLKENIKQFKIEQSKQKARGLNNYNIINVLRKPYEEVGLHSNFIYSLLDINGEHFQEDLFVNIFVKEVLKIDDFGKVLEVNQEELTTQNRRIDFTIKSEKYYIGIEMKIYAKDQKYQIYDYYQDLKSKVKNREEVKIYYLTLDGKNPSKESYIKNDNIVKYNKISFKNDILNWLQKCKNEVQNITNLNNAISYYIEIIEILTRTYKSKIIKLEDFLLSDKNIFEKAQEFYENHKQNPNDDIEKEIYQGYDKAREKLTKQFFEESLTNEIQKKLGYLGYKVTFENKDCDYKITVEKGNNKFILGSENYSKNGDYCKCNNEKISNKYRYRYDKQSVDAFFDKSEALEYFIDLIKECFDDK